MERVHMTNIITIQHTNGMIGSWRNWNLTELGIEQAKRIGERLSRELKNERYVIYSSKAYGGNYSRLF